MQSVKMHSNKSFECAPSGPDALSRAAHFNRQVTKALDEDMPEIWEQIYSLYTDLFWRGTAIALIQMFSVAIVLVGSFRAWFSTKATGTLMMFTGVLLGMIIEVSPLVLALSIDPADTDVIPRYSFVTELLASGCFLIASAGFLRISLAARVKHAT